MRTNVQRPFTKGMNIYGPVRTKLRKDDAIVTYLSECWKKRSWKKKQRTTRKRLLLLMLNTWPWRRCLQSQHTSAAFHSNIPCTLLLSMFILFFFLLVYIYSPSSLLGTDLLRCNTRRPPPNSIRAYPLLPVKNGMRGCQLWIGGLRRDAGIPKEHDTKPLTPPLLPHHSRRIPIFLVLKSLAKTTRIRLSTLQTKGSSMSIRNLLVKSRSSPRLSTSMQKLLVPSPSPSSPCLSTSMRKLLIPSLSRSLPCLLMSMRKLLVPSPSRSLPCLLWVQRQFLCWT